MCRKGSKDLRSFFCQKDHQEKLGGKQHLFSNSLDATVSELSVLRGHTNYSKDSMELQYIKHSYLPYYVNHNTQNGCLFANWFPKIFIFL